jgi:hypothetical protein
MFFIVDVTYAALNRVTTRVKGIADERAAVKWPTVA